MQEILCMKRNIFLTCLSELLDDRLGHRGQPAKEVLRADGDELDVKVQQRIGRDDGRRARRAVAEVRRDDELALGAHAHPGHALVPASDHFASAERELKRAALERGVEDGAVLEATGVCVRESRVERVRGAGEFNG